MNPFSSTTPPEAEPEFADPELTRLADELTERVLAGEPVDPVELMRDHPGQAEELKRLLSTVRILARAAGGDRMPAGSLQPGAEFHDFYLLRELGRGGMGVVFEARQRSLGRVVALKTLTAVAAMDERSRLRFEREARAAASLRHPHIVPVYAFDAEGRPPYFVMQLIDGASLAHVIEVARRVSQRGDGPEVAARMLSLLRGEPPGGDAPVGPTPSGTGPAPADPSHNPPVPADVPARFGAEYARAVARLGLQAAEALAYAHEEGVIHRDIKPANLLLDRGGDLWVVDFGLVKIADDPSPTLTRSPVGTAHYMSPEQADPTRGEVDGQSDVYSLGVTLYELLTLRRAFPEESYQRVIERVKTEEPPPIRHRNPSVPLDLETILEKAMAKDPGQRFESAAAMVRELRRFLAGQPLTIRRQTAWDRAARWAGRYFRELATGAGVAALTAVIVIAVLLGANRSIRRERDRAEAMRDVFYELVRTASLSNENLTQYLPLGNDEVHAALAGMVSACEKGLKSIPGGTADPELRYRSGVAHYYLALSLQVRGKVVNRRETLLHLDRSIDLLSGLARERRGETSARYNLVRVLGARSSLYIDSPALHDPESEASDSARRRHAEADAREALRVAEALVADYPERLDYRDLLAFQHYKLASALWAWERIDEAERHARDTLEIATELTLLPSQDRPVFLNNVYRARSTLGALAHGRGRLDEAERQFREALRVHEELAKSGPYQRNYDDERAATQRALAHVLRDTRRFDEAEWLLQEALATAERYAKLYPRHERHASTRYHILNDLGHLYATAGRPDKAEPLYRDLIVTLEHLRTTDPPPTYLAPTLADIYESCPIPELRNPEKAKALRAEQPGD